MPCKYFKHIDIEAIYEQLGKFDSESESLANIPTVFMDNVAFCFENLALEVADPEEDDPLNNIDPAVLAAKVSQLIEDCLDDLSKESTIALPEDDEDGLDRVYIIDSFAMWDSFQDDSLVRKLVLVSLEYDTLCWLYDTDDFYSAFTMTQIIARSFTYLERCYTLQVQECERRNSASLSARERAKKRHSATNEKKERLIKEWSDSSSEYKSRADFCRIISQREGMLYRTLYEWISRHDNANKPTS